MKNTFLAGATIGTIELLQSLPLTEIVKLLVQLGVGLVYIIRQIKEYKASKKQ